MDEIVLLEWSYTPSDYLEEAEVLNYKNVEISISKGKIEAKVKADNFDENPNLRNELHIEIESYFLGMQIFTNKPYELSKNPSMTRQYPNGRRDIYLSMEGGIIVSGSMQVNFIVKDKNGTIIKDSRKERIEKKREFAVLVAKHRPKNINVGKMVDSYNNAIRDQNNELVHLYEIRDTLQKIFSRGDIACKVLNLSKKAWRRLGSLANDEPLIQGRHRGQSVGVLRKATIAELKEARSIGGGMIEAYLRYLEAQIN